MTNQAECNNNNDDDAEKTINWQDEANAIIDDIKAHVAEVKIANQFIPNEDYIYLNLRTFEGSTWCIQVSSRGFRIVSNKYDTIDDRILETEGEEKKTEEIFETPYALLDRLSPRYVESFGNQLCQQLQQLQQTRIAFNELGEERLEEGEKQNESMKSGQNM